MSPRSTHRGLTIVGHKGATVILADRRLAPYLAAHDGEAITPDPSVRFIGAEQATSCDAACHKQGLRCRGDHLQWANTCDVLASVFACEAGCGHQIGQEIPCYVNDPTQVTHQQCLTTDGAPTSCKAQHRSTARVCPCG